MNQNLSSNKKGPINDQSSEKFIKFHGIINSRLEMSGDHSRQKQEIIERVKSMVFLCMYCNNETPMTATIIDFENYSTGAYATAFFICPDCRNKFVVKIQDIGKVRN